MQKWQYVFTIRYYRRRGESSVSLLMTFGGWAAHHQVVFPVAYNLVFEILTVVQAVETVGHARCSRVARPMARISSRSRSLLI